MNILIILSVVNVDTQKREAVMRHKENHKQPQELKYNMCTYTNKNEAQLNEHKESHKDKESLKFDMCNFAEEDPHWIQKHKESHREISELKCPMYGSILPSWQQAGSPIDDRPSTSFFGVLFGLDGEHFVEIQVPSVLWE